MGGLQCCPDQVHSPDLQALLPPASKLFPPSLAESLSCSLPPTAFEVANSCGLDRALQGGQDEFFCSPPCPYHLALCLACSRCVTIVCWVSEQVNSHNNLALSMR